MPHRWVLFCALVLCTWFLPPVSAYIYDDPGSFSTNCQIDTTGMIADRTNYKAVDRDPWGDVVDYHSSRRNTDTTMTTGGNISEIKDVTQNSVQKLITFEANESGHMYSDCGVTDDWVDPYWGHSTSARGMTIFNRSGTLEAKVSPPYGENFLTQSIKPLPNKPHTYSIADTRLGSRQEDPGYYEIWDSYFYQLILLDEPGMFGQTTDLKDKSLVVGDLKDYQKRYSGGRFYWWNNTTWYDATDEGGPCVFYRHWWD